jgi:N-acetylmuramoyl-L-alanine amidase
MMRRIDTIVIHQSDSAFGNAAVIDQWHRERGWSGIGYHWVILNGRIAGTAAPCSGAAKAAKDVEAECDGMIQQGRPPERVGAHVRGHNATSLGICLIGIGDGLPVGEGYITPAQWQSLVRLCRELMARYGVRAERVLGHREFPGVAKTCPGFEVAELRKALATDEARQTTKARRHKDTKGH